MARTFTGIAEVKAAEGEHLGYSEWLEITQDRIDKFAEATGDYQWIHVDVERAKKESPGGKTIAHGYLVLTLISPALTIAMLGAVGEISTICLHRPVRLAGCVAMGRTGGGHLDRHTAADWCHRTRPRHRSTPGCKPARSRRTPGCQRRSCP